MILTFPVTRFESECAGLLIKASEQSEQREVVTNAKRSPAIHIKMREYISIERVDGGYLECELKDARKLVKAINSAIDALEAR